MGENSTKKRNAVFIKGLPAAAIFPMTYDAVDLNLWVETSANPGLPSALSVISGTFK